MTTPTAPETTKVCLMKRRADGHHMTVVTFEVTGDAAVVSTYATWTDYRSRFEMSRAEARSDYSKLLREGYVPAKRIVDASGNPETVAA